MVFHTAFLDGTLPLLKQQLAVRKRLSCVILYLTLIRFFSILREDRLRTNIGKVFTRKGVSAGLRPRAPGLRRRSHIPRLHYTPGRHSQADAHRACLRHCCGGRRSTVQRR
jgi:IS5 family transposase